MHSIIFIMGVSGSGKTTIGKLLSEQLVVPFFDADDFHPASNIEKMKVGIPLTDDDRKDWLQKINIIATEQLQFKGAVIACSALKEKYREQLARNVHKVEWIYLKGDYELIHQRMEKRLHHYFSASMLQSQFDLLEEPANAIKVDVHITEEAIVNSIVKQLHMKSAFGIIGLGVMGKSLALNMAGEGVPLSLFNRFVKDKEEKVATSFIESNPVLQNAKGFESTEEFVQSLEKPRKILLMVNAGAPTDTVIDELKPFLSAGDILIDGGNSFYKDTERRINDMLLHGIQFIGAGISGGEEGALKGPSIMPGGNKEAYEQVKYYLELIAAKDKNGKACCAYISAGGSGHFVKMVHNAIEYAEMQLLSEVYDVMRNGFDLSPDAIANEFSEWNQTEVNSYLLEITIAILQTKENKEWLLDKILDVGSSKGTGSWAVASAAELGVPSGMMTAALYARFLSAEKELRIKASEVFKNDRKSFNVGLNELKEAYTLARIINHYQGFELIKAAAKKYDWTIQLNELARIWTNGCIIRSALMEQFVEVVAESDHLLLHPTTISQIQKAKPSLIKVCIESLKAGFAVPALSEALNFLNGIVTKESAMNLIQAQRDYFGAHAYERIDDTTGKAHHTQWKQNKSDKQIEK